MALLELIQYPAPMLRSTLCRGYLFDHWEFCRKDAKRATSDTDHCLSSPQALKIEGILNGKVMQFSNTDKMILKIAYLIHYITQAITLEPGDVIATGTPEGVGVFRTPPVLLKDGDVFDVVIEKVGTLRNTFVNA